MKRLCSALLRAGSDGFISTELLRETRRHYGLSRRSDRFTALLLSAVRRLQLPDDLPGEQTAIVVASKLGPQGTVCAFQDDLLQYPEDQVMPTTFSHSVNNAAASYLSMLHKITGPAFSLTGFHQLYREAFLFADGLLQHRNLRYIVLCFGEEKTIVTDAVRSILPEIPEEFSAALLLGEGPDPLFAPLQEDAEADLTRFTDIAPDTAGTP